MPATLEFLLSIDPTWLVAAQYVAFTVICCVAARWLTRGTR